MYTDDPINNLIVFTQSKYNTDITKYVNFISAKITTMYGFTIMTYKIKSKTSDDKIYLDNPKLVDILPRAYSLVFKDSKLIKSIMGPKKFSGLTKFDDDEEEGYIKSNKEIYGWESKNILQIIRTDKENGKFVIFSLFEFEDKDYIIAGSKNNHFILLLDDIRSSCDYPNDTIKSIFIDIGDNFEKLYRLKEELKTLSLCGELCDGKHFTDGDNKIHWFGMFNDGNALDQLETLNFLKSRDLQIVNYEEITDIKIDNVLNLSKCFNNEGSVLYFRNIITNKTILIKTKSIIYICKRFIREKLKNGYMNIEKIKQRFIDAIDYHCLKTTSAIRITKILMNFGIWLMNNKYPCNVIACADDTKFGFNHYWKEYVKTNEDIVITPDDFGSFDKDEYLNSEDLQLYPLRHITDMPLVIFTQGIQGSGKSSIAKLLNGLIVEQDDFNGCTFATQGYLYHSIRNNNSPNIIIVSRCNCNKNQYNKYLQIALNEKCPVIFIAPNITNDLYLAISLAGIIKRTEKEYLDKSKPLLKIGNNYLDMKEVFKFTIDNYKNLDIHKNAIRYNYMDSLEDFNMEIINNYAYLDKYMEYIINNVDKLCNMRVPLDIIKNDILEKINNNSDKFLNAIISKPLNEVLYIGCFLDKDNITILKNKIKEFYGDINTDNIKCEHLTQIYLNKQNIKDFDYLPNYSIVKIIVDKLVIRKSDNMSALRCHVYSNDNIVSIYSRKPHITAYVPDGCRAFMSNEFVMLEDDSVIVHDFNITLDAKTIYH